MSLFATEFPIKDSITAGEFVAQVIAWLRGNRFSTVLDKKSNHEIDTIFAHLQGENGEELLLRSLEKSDGSVAFGFRHDIRDDEGRLWRTEAVLKQNFPSLAGNFIRFKTQCTAIGPTARIDTPRKP
jgi:4-diphosphocytidyl-2C-methyl-D-erythritol kinase